MSSFSISEADRLRPIFQDLEEKGQEKSEIPSVARRILISSSELAPTRDDPANVSDYNPLNILAPTAEGVPGSLTRRKLKELNQERREEVEPAQIPAPKRARMKPIEILSIDEEEGAGSERVAQNPGYAARLSVIRMIREDAEDLPSHIHDLEEMLRALKEYHESKVVDPVFTEEFSSLLTDLASKIHPQ